MSRQFFFTKQTCEMLHHAIIAKYPDIKGLKVFPEIESKEIIIKFEDNRYTPREIEEFINSLPKYVK